MKSIDNPGNYAKFNCPTIANGKVYLATFSNRLMVYGLQKGLITGINKEGVIQPRLYPNPTKDIFKVSTPGDQTVGIKIVDLSGRTVYETDAVYNDDEVSVANLVSGIYVVQIRTGDSVFVQKLIIQK